MPYGNGWTQRCRIAAGMEEHHEGQALRSVIERNPASKPAWWLLDDDSRVVAWAGRTFVSLAHADQAAHDFRVNADDPDYRFRAKAGTAMGS